MIWPFVVHQTYHRLNEIHRPFSGQQQSGIATPTKAPGIFIFTSVNAKAVGYKDVFQPNGSLHYTGQGKLGDMKMTFVNAAIRDHAANGKDLLVFSQMGNGKGVRFEGLFVCATWFKEHQLDNAGQDREAIVFSLVPLRDVDHEANDLNDQPTLRLALRDLRLRAMAAAAPARGAQAANLATVFNRSRDVRDYVLARADGICEACTMPAPFKTLSGRPYLEAHHIRRLSDGGPDDPRFVAGICPNCHRQAHHGDDQRAFNENLQNTISEKEIKASARNH